ncbi:endonuclease [Roseiconus nitratireducens]|uniref:Endonuclease n=2 Tax=Roseiconus nitratireducens TaxID=2605748 RepID=A0A5M6CYZ4_9BACT|nr:endonuclease [Roseiconus nitratireducens]
MSWNLEWFFDEYQGDNHSALAKEKSSPSRDDWNGRRDAVASAIASRSPTVVAVQEVESRRVLWYLTRAIARHHRQAYREFAMESEDHYTEQDVGFLVRDPADLLSISHQKQTRAMRRSQTFFDLSKHLFGVFSVPAGDRQERVTILNVHMRSRPEAASIRQRQARLAHHWIADAIAAGGNVIVLGDFNTEETGDEPRPGTDLGILCGMETDAIDDDLVDLTRQLPAAERSTHLLGKHFDRILVSQSLLDDDPAAPDLVFESVSVLPALAIRAERDDPLRHWEHFWEIPDEERDLSDHYPVLASFRIR